MTEVQVNVSVDDLYRQLGQMHVVIAQLREQNQKLADRIRQLEADINSVDPQVLVGFPGLPREITPL